MDDRPQKYQHDESQPVYSSLFSLRAPCATNRVSRPTSRGRPRGATLEFIRIWRNIRVVARCATLAVDRSAESVERRAFLNRATAFATFQRMSSALTLAR